MQPRTRGATQPLAAQPSGKAAHEEVLGQVIKLVQRMLGPDIGINQVRFCRKCRISEISTM